MTEYLLAIDQGTTGTTALLIDRQLRVHGKVNVEFAQIYPQPGWVSHNPLAIWNSALDAIAQVLRKFHVSGDQIAGIGITTTSTVSGGQRVSILALA